MTEIYQNCFPNLLFLQRSQSTKSFTKQKQTTEKQQVPNRKLGMH